MVEATRRQQSAEFDTVWQTWWEETPVPKSLSAGIVRRIDVKEMMGVKSPLPADTAQSLVEAIGGILGQLLADNATCWSPAPGLIDIHYRVASKKAAELKHSVVVSSVERCVRALAEDTAAAPMGDGKAAATRRVEWEKFQTICMKAKVLADQIQILDVGEALFGVPEPDVTLSRRIWGAVDEILDQALATSGYCTRYSRNRVLLFFPGYSNAMGDLKRKAIVDDIASACRRLVGRDGEETEMDEPAPKVAPKPVKRRSPAPQRVDNAERAQANQAFAALAAARADNLPDPDELDLPARFDIRLAPMWWAKKRTVGGYVVEPVVRSGSGWERHFASSAAEPDMLDLPVVARGILRIQEQIAAGKSSIVVVPVHWAYLDHARPRERYIAFCGRLPEAARHLLVLEVTGMPEDLMQSRVEERISQLRPCCRAVTCRVRLGRRDFSQFKKLPIYAIGVDMGELPDYERGIIPGLDAFMDAVEPHGLKTFANGLNTKSLLVAAQAAGVDFVSGHVIPDSDQAPLGIRDFTIADLYEKPGAP